MTIRYEHVFLTPLVIKFDPSEIGLLQHIIQNQKTIMASQSDLDTKLDELKQTVSDTATRIGTGFQALLDAIKAGSTPADLTNEVASVQSDIDLLKGINIPAVPGSTPPAPAA